MAIVVNLDVMLAKRKMRSKELAERIGITETNLSLLKSGKVKGIRFETLENICAVLECEPGDILEYRLVGDGKDSDFARQLEIGRETMRERRDVLAALAKL